MFNEKHPKSKIKFFEASPFQIVSLSFLFVILAGTLLLSLPISSRERVFTSPLNALFTATSATCVTGLVVYDTGTYWSTFGQIVILTLIQIGGLGLVTLTSFFNLIVGKKMGFRGIELAKESINTDSFADVKKMLKTIMVLTFSIEFTGAIILALTFIPEFGFAKGAYISIFTAVSAFCNAGFDLLGFQGEFCSLSNYTNNFLVYGTVALLIILGGIGFIVMRDIFRYRKSKKLMLHTKVVLVVTAILIIGGGILFTILEWNNVTMEGLSVCQKVGAGFFHSVSTRTAGFNTIPQDTLTNLSKVLSTVLMFIGASPASTGGGIKVTTIAVIIMTIVSVLRGREDTTMHNATVSKKAVYRALALFFLAIFWVTFASIVIMLSLDGQASAMDVIFETTSAFGTVGLSVGITSIAGVLEKIVLIASMYLGRVGPITLMISLTLINESHKEVLPKGKIIIG